MQEPLSDIITELNKKITLTCIISGVPTPNITWFKNGTEITSTQITYENKISKYIIENTTEETSAKYTCKATNEVGSTETTCFVIVQEKPSIVIEEKLINQTLRTATEWKVLGNITGHPEPEITWFREDVKIEKSERFSHVYTNKTSTTTITNLVRTDSGKYTVEAKNEAGTSSATCYLKVIGK